MTKPDPRSLPLRGDKIQLPETTHDGWERLQAWWSSDGVYFKRGVELADASIAASVKAVAAELDGGSPAAHDPVADAALMVMLDYRSRRQLTDFDGHANERYLPIDQWLVARWIEAGGLPRALEVLTAFTRLTVDDSRAGSADTHTLCIKPGDVSWWALENGWLGPLHVVRRHAVAASGADYRAGVAAASKLRESAPIWMCAALSFAFPDERGFAESDAAASKPKSAKTKSPAWSWGLVTTTLDDPAALARILESMAKDDQPYDSGTLDYADAIADRLGPAAAPLLLGYKAATRSALIKKRVDQALKRIDTTRP